MLSIPHLIIVFVVALVVFGPQKLPELARNLGKLLAEFRKASGDFKSAFEEEMRDLDRQAQLAERRKAAEATAASVAAEPSQPATLATPAGTTAPPEAEPQLDRRETEAPVITPVSESIARTPELGKESSAEPEPAAATAAQDTAHDAQHPA
jgi:TatA/E family protein of Tat protein translocase